MSRTYDSANRITSETLTVGATPYSIGYGYDADNRQTHVTYPDGSIAVRNFTDRNQLSVVTFNNALVANFAYDNAGRKVATGFGNGLTEARTYQADNLNTSINTPGVTSFGYTWDANKRKLSQTETGIPTNDQTYAYDNEDRLTGFNRNNGDNQSWNLSLVGDWNQTIINGTPQNRTHNAVHEITTVDANPLVHDMKGNLATNKNGQIYAWDIENRLTTATVPAGCPEGIAGAHGYTYDALGRRVSKTVGGNTTVFVSDGMQEIAEYVNGAFSQSYVYGSYIDEPLLKTDNAGNKIYYHANNLFSIAALTDNAGTVVERYKYDPYGKATILAADGITVRAASLYGNPWQDRGRRTDLETSLQFYRARMWDMNLGRFTNRDPLGYVDGLNLYQGYFIPNDMDPMGTTTKQECLDACWARHSAYYQKAGHGNVDRIEEVCNYKCTEHIPSTFKGFENDRFQQHDALIARIVFDFNNNKVKYCGCDAEQSGTVPDLSSNFIKAWLMTESGGSPTAWAKDPGQVNVPGDWGKEKEALGLKKPVKRNEGDVEQNIRAAIAYLCRKGFGKSGKAPGPQSTFDNWRKALERYNAAKDPKGYAENIINRAQTDNYVPLEYLKK